MRVSRRFRGGNVRCGFLRSAHSERSLSRTSVNESHSSVIPISLIGRQLREPVAIDSSSSVVAKYDPPCLSYGFRGAADKHPLGRETGVRGRGNPGSTGRFGVLALGLIAHRLQSGDGVGGIANCCLNLLLLSSTHCGTCGLFWRCRPRVMAQCSIQPVPSPTYSSGELYTPSLSASSSDTNR